jgi:hypothetical protein
VILDLNKAEIDDAHKDKQKMFSDNFKVSSLLLPNLPTDDSHPFQVGTIFQRIPQTTNHINRLNSNGTHRLSNVINNNASSNNFNMAESMQSQSSDGSMLRNASGNHFRRSENYQTTSEGSTSPESSSESSTEDWESGESKASAAPHFA